ncbi:hypothetical protein ACFLX9_01725 [Chloroflexota bacterium]
MPPLEAWEKPWVRSKPFLASVHGQIGCTACHGGNAQAGDKALAHEAIVTDPSVQPEQSCGGCHGDIAGTFTLSLHSTFRGLETALLERAGQEEMPTSLVQAVDNHCANCHASCGQCHVSIPTYLGGGLSSGHKFMAEPPMAESCMACHGTRVGHEYTGANEGVAPDVHWEKAHMPCTECHSEELHGTGEEYDQRYAEEEGPQCIDCHQSALSPAVGIIQHTIHDDKLSCQTCHSQVYKNCFGCHVGIDSKGVAYAKSEASVMDFKIGRNVAPSPLHPYEYAPVRHVPVEPDTFAYYGEGLLPDFDARPTWLYATPHNIQRITPQNQSCDACHGNDDLFLTPEDVQPEEQEANKDVVLEASPAQ